MEIMQDRIANAVIDTFDNLPAKFKPGNGNNDRREWVPMSGIVVVKGKISMLRHKPSRLTEYAGKAAVI